MSRLRVMVKNALVRNLYQSGALGFWHRWRNRHSLTVIMFHRIVDPGDDRWLSCDPEYTLAAELFEQSVLFFRNHYNLVTIDEVAHARNRPNLLPEVPLLVTFDDGWSDQAEFAAPVLAKYQCPSVLFVASDVIGRTDGFWQEKLIGAWRSSRLTVFHLGQIYKDIGISVPDVGVELHVAISREDLDPIRRLISHLECMPTDKRQKVLEKYCTVLTDPTPQMIRLEQLSGLAAQGMVIGAHGHSHEPLTSIDDPLFEMNESRERLFQATREYPRTMSFPHGAYSDNLIDQAHGFGFDMLFTSVRALNGPAQLASGVLGRVGITAETICDERGVYRPEKLAWYLFRVARLSEDACIGARPR